jgi:hypothetical protein
MYVWLAVAVAFALSLGFGGIQTWNLRVHQRQCAEAIASYLEAISIQNAKVTEWEGKAKTAQAKSAQAVKAAIEAGKVAKEREAVILSQPRPLEQASCQEREIAVLELLRRARIR